LNFLAPYTDYRHNGQLELASIADRHTPVAGDISVRFEKKA